MQSSQPCGGYSEVSAEERDEVRTVDKATRLDNIAKTERRAENHRSC